MTEITNDLYPHSISHQNLGQKSKLSYVVRACENQKWVGGFVYVVSSNKVENSYC